jgi:SAM-dependent methyltransferase
MKSSLNSDSYFDYLRKRGRIKRLLRRLFLRPLLRHFSGRILDIGCGIGDVLRLYPDSVGIDADPESVTFCRTEGLSCFQASATDLPFAEDSFEGVLMNNVLEHLEHPEEAFAEIRRVLRKGGRLVLELPGKKGYAYDPTHVRHWDRGAITAFLAERGFTDIRTWFFPVPFEWAGDFLTHNKLRVVAVHSK